MSVRLMCYRENCKHLWNSRDRDEKYPHCPSCGCSNVYQKAFERAEDYRRGGREAVTLDPITPSAPKGDPAQAFKSDAGKVQYNLLEDGCGVALNYIAQVMSWAVEVKGYHPHSWREVPNAITRYRAALGRHRNAIARGEVLDPESGLPHWAHAACCVIFLLELENFNV